MIEASEKPFPSLRNALGWQRGFWQGTVRGAVPLPGALAGASVGWQDMSLDSEKLFLTYSF